MDYNRTIQLIKQSIAFTLELATDLDVSIPGDFYKWERLEANYHACLSALKCYSEKEHACFINAGDFTHHVNEFAKTPELIIN